MSFKLLKIGRCAEETQSVSKGRFGNAEPKRRASIRVALVAAAVCVATAPSPSYADKTISENTILTEDTDWSGEGTVTIAEGVTLDLNGYILTVAGIDGAGSIVDSLADYERLEYIQSTGTQYIDTGYKHDDTTKVDMRIEFDTVSPDWQCFYGSRNYDSNAQDQFSMWLNKNKFRPSIAERGTAISSPVVSTGTIYDIHLEKKKGGSCTATPEGGSTISLGSATVSGASLPANDYLLIVHQYHDNKWYTEFPTYAKLYSCQIYSGETLERDFVPVKRRSDGALGLLDKANNAFYGNAGGGTFIAGATVSVGGLRIALPGIGVASDFSGLTVGEGVTLAFVGEGALAANLDVTKVAFVEVSSGAVLDLAGHNLTVNSVVGDGRITDTVGTALSGYDRLNYIQATGTQYIDTGYIHNDTSVVDMRIEFDSVSPQWQCFYGSRIYNTEDEKQLSMWLTYDQFRPSIAARTTATIDSPRVSTGTIYDIHLEKKVGGSCTATPEGGSAISLGGATVSGSSLSANDYLFVVNQRVGSNWEKRFPTYAKLYSCKIYSGETLERDFVPAKRKRDNVLGLLDLANGKFYANAGTGTFNAGTVVATTPGGELHIVVVEGNTASLGDMAKISGTVKVVKDGAGELALPTSGTCFSGGLEVAAGTLSMTQTPVNLLKTPISASVGGTISIAAGDGAIYTNDFMLAGGTLNVLASGSGVTTTTTIDGTLALETGAADVQPAVSIDMTDCTGATFLLSTTALTSGEGVTAAPGFVAVSDAGMFEASVEGSTIKVENLTAPVTAVWTGLGEAGNFDDPNNWSCSNKYGIALSNTTIPDLGGSTATLRLAADADWTGESAIALGAGVVLDLAGHSLTVASITGDGEVVDSIGTALSGYDRVEYIQSTSTGEQFIDTGYVHNDTTKVDIRVSFDTVSKTWQCIYGARNTKNAKTRFTAWLGNNIFGRELGAARQDISSSSLKAKVDEIYDIHLDKTGYFSVTPENGQTVSKDANSSDNTSSGGGLAAGQTDYLFAIHESSNGTSWGTYHYTVAKLYSCKIYTGETLERDFVPVRRKSDNVLGLLDLANGGFYANAGTGTFNAGAVVETTPGGELHITVAEGDTLSLDSLAKISGSVKVVKDGAGTLVAPATGQVFFGGIEVEEGTLSMGGALAYGGEIDAASGTTVSVPASVGSAGMSVVNMEGGTFEVAGCGTSAVGGTVTLATNTIDIVGSFAPVSGAAAYAVTLSDGTTLDFTQWEGAFPIAYPTLAYASGANIALKLEPATTAITALARSRDAETGRRNGYLLSWDAIPAGVTFSPDAATRARFRVVSETNGLRVSFKGGFCIIIK